MSWPTDNLSTSGLDAGSDTPPRATFLAMCQAIKAIIAARGANGGVASLGAGGKVPDAQLGRGSAGGVASLGSDGRVPGTQLPQASSVWDAGDIKVTGRSTAPDGWLSCDGSAVSRTTYADLFAAIGTAYGEGDGSTSFDLPDFRDRVILGASATRAVGATGGSETHTLTESEMPSHSHGKGTLATSSGGSHSHSKGTLATASAGAHTHSYSRKKNASNRQYGNSGTATDILENATTGSAGSHSHSITGSTGSTGSGSAHNIMQPWAAALIIIKT